MTFRIRSIQFCIRKVFPFAVFYYNGKVFPFVMSFHFCRNLYTFENELSSMFFYFIQIIVIIYYFFTVPVNLYMGGKKSVIGFCVGGSRLLNGGRGSFIVLFRCLLFRIPRLCIGFWSVRLWCFSFFLFNRRIFVKLEA